MKKRKHNKSPDEEKRKEQKIVIIKKPMDGLTAGVRQALMKEHKRI